MNISAFHKIAPLACILSVANFTMASAQDDSTTTPAPPDDNHPWHHGPALTPEEHAELKKDRDQVFASNPDLKTEGQDLWNQRKDLKNASESDKQAFLEKFKAHRDKLNAAMEAIDPNAAALIAKDEASHPHHHAAGATTPPASGQ